MAGLSATVALKVTYGVGSTIDLGALYRYLHNYLADYSSLSTPVKMLLLVGSIHHSTLFHLSIWGALGSLYIIGFWFNSYLSSLTAVEYIPTLH